LVKIFKIANITQIRRAALISLKALVVF
jgi:hypothetical protein